MLLFSPRTQAILEILTAGGTAFAAVFAAISAWFSGRSAQIASTSIEEARTARRIELSPKLTIEKNFLDFHFTWPHRLSLNGEAVFLARKHWKDADPSPPTFTLQNFGQSPALEVTIVFELEDPNGEFELPSGYESLGLRITDSPTTDNQTSFKSLMYAKPDGSACALPLYHKYTIDLPHCAPSQRRIVEFPTLLLNTLFLRGLQYWKNYQRSSQSQDIILTARVLSYSVDNTSYETQFRWRITPFHHAETRPIKVYGHCIELPMYPKPDGPRVA